MDPLLYILVTWEQSKHARCLTAREDVREDVVFGLGERRTLTLAEQTCHRSLIHWILLFSGGETNKDLVAYMYTCLNILNAPFKT